MSRRDLRIERIAYREEELAGGVVPAVVAGLLATGAMILAGVVTLEQAYRAITWRTGVLAVLISGRGIHGRAR
jgi:hypothetical protein